MLEYDVSKFDLHYAHNEICDDERSSTSLRLAQMEPRWRSYVRKKPEASGMAHEAVEAGGGRWREHVRWHATRLQACDLVCGRVGACGVQPRLR